MYFVARGLCEAYSEKTGVVYNQISSILFRTFALATIIALLLNRNGGTLWRTVPAGIGVVSNFFRLLT